MGTRIGFGNRREDHLTPILCPPAANDSELASPNYSGTIVDANTPGGEDVHGFGACRRKGLLFFVGFAFGFSVGFGICGWGEAEFFPKVALDI